MKTRIMNVTLIAAMLAASGAAQAGHGQYDRDGDGFTSRARVISSTPIYETVNEPRRQCWTETTGYDTRSYREPGNNTGATVIGAIAGGLLGSTVGKGNGKVAAAAVGAATGAVVGNRWNDNGSRYYESSPRQVERCRTEDNYRDVVAGYDVRYRFQGRDYRTRLPYDPGRWVTLDVNFNVADQRDGQWNNSRYERDY